MDRHVLPKVILFMTTLLSLQQRVVCQEHNADEKEKFLEKVDNKLTYSSKAGGIGKHVPGDIFLRHGNGIVTRWNMNTSTWFKSSGDIISQRYDDAFTDNNTHTPTQTMKVKSKYSTEMFKDARLKLRSSSKKYKYSKWILENTEHVCSGVLSGMHNEYYGDYIECSPCICIRGEQNILRADCSNRGLRTIPSTLPRDVFLINMAFNDMHEFNISTIMIYPQLNELDLRQNRILHILGPHNLSKTNRTGHPSLSALNLYYNRLYGIQNDTMQALPNLRSLQLSRNNIKIVKNNTLKGLRQLLHLDLSSNGLEYLENNAFGDLKSLMVLCLNKNRNLGYSKKALRTVIFKPLRKIRVLFMEEAFHGCMYFPNNVFEQTRRLEILSIDGIKNSVLFSKPMKHVNTIMIKYNALCDIDILSSDLFRNAPNLRKVHISRCKLKTILNDTFQNNTALEYLSLEYLPTYDLEVAFKELGAMQISSLKELRFVHLYHGSHCRHLSENEAQYIKKSESRNP